MCNIERKRILESSSTAVRFIFSFNLDIRIYIIIFIYIYIFGTSGTEIHADFLSAFFWVSALAKLLDRLFGAMAQDPKTKGV
jgi:hypothetical protein